MLKLLNKAIAGEGSIAKLLRQIRVELGDLRLLIGVLAAFGAAIAIGTELTRESGNAAAIWPANGLPCAALFLVPRAGTRIAMLVLGALTNFLVMLVLGDVPLACLAFAVINPSEAFLTFWLIKRFCDAPLNFTYGRNLVSFFLSPDSWGQLCRRSAEQPQSICSTALISGSC